jgi:YHS domain-containing protein
VIRVILLAILVLLVARAFWRLIDGIMEAAGGTTGRRAQSPAVKLVRDPVCGTHVPSANALSLTAGGVTHYFCSEQCRAEFRRRT